MTTTYRVLEQSTSPFQQQVISFIDDSFGLTPSNGDRYIIGTGANAFVSKDNSIAWYDTSWHFDVPAKGWLVENDDNGHLYLFDGSAWINEDVTAKADKVAGAPNGYLAGLDVDGNLTNSNVTVVAAADAISHVHSQGTDQALDTGGGNEITAAHAKEAYEREAQYDSVLKVLKFTI